MLNMKYFNLLPAVTDFPYFLHVFLMHQFFIIYQFWGLISHESQTGTPWNAEKKQQDTNEIFML